MALISFHIVCQTCSFFCPTLYSLQARKINEYLIGILFVENSSFPQKFDVCVYSVTHFLLLSDTGRPHCAQFQTFTGSSQLSHTSRCSMVENPTRNYVIGQPELWPTISVINSHENDWYHTIICYVAFPRTQPRADNINNRCKRCLGLDFREEKRKH